MNEPPDDEYDYLHFLDGLQNMPLAEVEKLLADRIEDLEIRAICVEIPAQCRNVGMLKFLFDLRELREFFRYHLPPATMSWPELQAHRPLFAALVARSDWPEICMHCFDQRKSSAGSFYESELERRIENIATLANSETAS